MWKILTQVLTHWGLVSVISAQDGAEYPNSNPNLIIPTKNPASKPQNAPYNKNDIILWFILRNYNSKDNKVWIVLPVQ